MHVCKHVAFYEMTTRALLLTLQYGILSLPWSAAKCLKEGSVPTAETLHFWWNLGASIYFISNGECLLLV